MVNIGRGSWIRTNDPLLPKQMRYQTALYPEYLAEHRDALQWRRSIVIHFGLCKGIFALSASRALASFQASQG